mmetsp:Transcript_13349/g.48593  ORF Transcript_13349/g.48593 Transcript_13349/m.48593 type:complete len:210 (-) Transcript_13349:216-845(-)
MRMQTDLAGTAMRRHMGVKIDLKPSYRSNMSMSMMTCRQNLVACRRSCSTTTDLKLLIGKMISRRSSDSGQLWLGHAKQEMPMPPSRSHLCRLEDPARATQTGSATLPKPWAPKERQTATSRTKSPWRHIHIGGTISTGQESRSTLIACILASTGTSTTRLTMITTVRRQRLSKGTSSIFSIRISSTSRCHQRTRSRRIRLTLVVRPAL